MSDHFSGPAVMGDPSVDISDFFAFPSPERPGNLVLIMDVFPLATPDSRFSNVVTHRFRLRPLARSERRIVVGANEYTIDVRFSDVPEGTAVQKGQIITSDGLKASFTVGEQVEEQGMRVFAGLVSDPFFMDVEATLRTDFSGKMSFDTAANTVQFRDVLSIVVEVPFRSIVERFGGVTLIAAVSETAVPVNGKPLRLEHVGRPETKNVLMANPTRDPRAKNIELRDLYNREDTFALSDVYRPLYETRLDANLAYWDELDWATAWPVEEDGRHPLRDLFLGDFLIVDLANPFCAGSFLEIERALMDDRSHNSAGGRWLDDDILDDMLSMIVNGGRGKRVGDGVDMPTKPAARTFPYVREPNLRSDLPLPAFLKG
ncbi:DUF4331 family protein [Mesorhizobium sp.]|uniref:DUF4331 family protein n=1 Tax=Mesorhizobium sp. TaxID=1871066 RepID=UPI00122632DD|nr:DUF4331 family protein [Mesorhizobium sp.]TIV61338.1 MAG: DUF4331 domain-containing protein [Mesorhizobium sp.]